MSAKHMLSVTTDELLNLTTGMEMARAVLIKRIAFGEVDIEDGTDRTNGTAVEIMRRQLAAIDDVIEDRLKPCFGDLYDEIMRGGM